MHGLKAACPIAAHERPQLGLLTRGVQQVATLPALLPEWQLVRAGRAQRLDAVLAWGRKPSARVAEERAARDGLPLIRVEDGFLRSVGLGHRCPPLSIVVDERGIHYDAAAPSRLERLIGQPTSAAQAARARRLREAWVHARVSKYNHCRVDAGPWRGAGEPRVLVVDQTFGDASIAGAGASAGHFTAMLEAALDEHPQARILLKVHPDVIAGRKRGHFAALSPGQAARVDLLADDIHPPALFEASQAVYVVSSQMGFEALLWQRPVRCFGMPFFAGWGLTHDEMPAPTRRHAAPLESLIDGTLVQYPRYLDPETGAPCSPERLIEHIALQRRTRARFAAQVQAIGFSRWKRPIARAFFDGSTVEFRRRPGAGVSAADAVAAVWGRKPAPAGPRVVRVEDGFIRSVGLGADLTRPLSWVQDDLGIYFDATRPSRLEQLLLETDFDPVLRQRAQALRAALVGAGVTKYNVGAGVWSPPRDGRRTVLVPGQVENDASIAWGGCGLRGNLELLQAARAHCRGDHLVYKPHPDVLAGLRGTPAQARRLLDAAREHCDEIVTDVAMGTLLQQVDVVHTLTSLAGFEALLRGKTVVTWGLPFYAGWGLTLDRAPADAPALQRRRRTLSLDELVAGTLILYPTYVSRSSGAFTTPERALQELIDWQRSAPQADPSAAWRTLKRRVLQWAARWRGA